MNIHLRSLALRAFAVLLSLLAFTSSARAHDGHGPGAKVVQRGRHLRIELYVDALAYVARHAPAAPGTAPPLPEMLAALPAETIPPMIASAERALREAVDLSLDGERVALVRVSLPSVEEIQRRAWARMGKNAEAPGAEAPAIVAEAVLPRSEGTLSLGFGAEMGAVSVSFSAPQVQVVPGGGTMTVPLGAPRPVEPSPAGARMEPSAPVGLGLVLLASALAFLLGARLTARAPSDPSPRPGCDALRGEPGGAAETPR